MTKTTIIAAMVMAMTAMSSRTLPGAIESADRMNKWWFVASSGAALLVLVFGVLSWMAGNRVQQAIKADADARIAEAGAVAAEANERSKILEGDNLELRGKVAGLEKDAAEAKTALAAQEEVTLTLRGQIATLETKAAEQQERAAKAELALLELQQRLAPRHLEPEKRNALIRYLQNASKYSDEKRARLVVNCLGPISEPCIFADEIVSALKEGGWPTVEYNRGGTMSGADSEGVLIRSKNLSSLGLMRNALLHAGIDADTDPHGANEEVLILWVGYKKTD